MLKKMRLLLGGAYHDFEGFAAAVRPLFEADGYAVEATYDLTSLERLAAEEIDLVLMYTCFGAEAADETPNVAQTEALFDWVQKGGGLLAVHGATVIPEDNGTLRDLVGGAFISHPPQFAFSVTPMAQPHPIIRDVAAFTVEDELYLHRYRKDVRVHMIAVDRGVAHPMVWTREEGSGRVVYVAPGHGLATWEHPAYRRLLRRAATWLVSA
ncbi:MAG: ThuA domain-containing protein [Anaerolineae bacterium]